MTPAVSLGDMSDNDDNDTRKHASQELLVRITHVEELLTHLQRSLQEISDVVLGQQERSDKIERNLAQLTEQLRAMSEPDAADADLEDERPPHY